MNQPHQDQELATARTKIASGDKTVYTLRPLPAIALRVSEACQDSNSGTQQLAQIVEGDAAFAAKILQVVNSSLYGCTREITTIRQSLVVLGRKSVVQLAMSIAAQKVFYCDDATKQARSDLFGHSLAVGTVARLITNTDDLDLDPGSAFLAGIVHDVGKLVLLDLAPNIYPQLLANLKPEVSLSEAEHRLFGADHATLGQALGESWNLTSSIVNVIGRHHDCESASLPEMTRVVAIADELVHLWDIGPGTHQVHPRFANDWLAQHDEAAVDEFRQRAIDCALATHNLMTS